MQRINVLYSDRHQRVVKTQKENNNTWVLQQQCSCHKPIGFIATAPSTPLKELAPCLRHLLQPDLGDVDNNSRIHTPCPGVLEVLSKISLMKTLV